MTLGDFLYQYWWLMFPVFGMVMAVLGFLKSEDASSRSFRGHD